MLNYNVPKYIVKSVTILTEAESSNTWGLSGIAEDFIKSDKYKVLSSFENRDSALLLKSLFLDKLKSARNITDKKKQEVIEKLNKCNTVHGISQYITSIYLNGTGLGVDRGTRLYNLRGWRK